MEAWWKGWAIPIVQIGGDVQIARAVVEPSDTALSVLQRLICGADDVPASRSAVFIVEIRSEDVILGFKVSLEDTDGGLEVVGLGCPFDHGPVSGPKLGSAIMWTLFDLIGFDSPWHRAFRGRRFEKMLEQMPFPASSMMLSLPSPKLEMQQIRERSAHIGSLSSMHRIEPAVADFLRLVKLTTKAIDFDDPDIDSDHGYAAWPVHLLGMGNIIDLHLQISKDASGVRRSRWCLINTSTQDLTPEFDTPLEAMMALPMWWDIDDPEGYLDRVVPEAQWAEGLLPILEPFRLLDEPSPLLWPSERLEPWARALGLL